MFGYKPLQSTQRLDDEKLKNKSHSTSLPNPNSYPHKMNEGNSKWGPKSWLPTTAHFHIYRPWPNDQSALT